jgi:heme O synthase-like polyprenyltransferase
MKINRDALFAFSLFLSIFAIFPVVYKITGNWFFASFAVVFGFLVLNSLDSIWTEQREQSNKLFKAMVLMRYDQLTKPSMDEFYPRMCKRHGFDQV